MGEMTQRVHRHFNAMGQSLQKYLSSDFSQMLSHITKTEDFSQNL